MIFRIIWNWKCPVCLLKQNYPCKLMRKRHFTERKLVIAKFFYFITKPEWTADYKANAWWSHWYIFNKFWKIRAWIFLSFKSKTLYISCFRYFFDYSLPFLFNHILNLCRAWIVTDFFFINFYNVYFAKCAEPLGIFINCVTQIFFIKFSNSKKSNVNQSTMHIASFSAGET